MKFLCNNINCKLQTKIFFLFIFLFPFMIFTGCSLVGYSIGRQVDQKVADNLIIASDTLMQNRHYLASRDIIILMKDETVKKGKVDDIDNPDYLVIKYRKMTEASNYSKPYKENIRWNEIDEVLIPDPGYGWRMTCGGLGSIVDSVFIFVGLVGLILSYIISSIIM